MLWMHHSCYRGGLFNGGGMVMLERWSVYWRENGFVTVGLSNGGETVMLGRWPV